MNIKEFREKYPQYNDLSDQELSDKFYNKYYSDMPREQFNQKFLGYAGEISTITGKPIPTLEEEWARGKEAGKVLLTTGGDIAGTMLMPQVKGPQLGIKALNLLLRGAGAGTGSFGGTLAGQQLLEGKMDIDQATKEALMGGGFELGTGALGMAGKPLAKFVAEHTTLGRHIMDKARKRLMGQVTEESQEAVTKMGLPETTIPEAEEAIGKVFPKSDEYFGGYQRAFDDLKQASREGRINLDDTMQFLGEIAEKHGNRVAPTLKAIGVSPTSEYGKALKRLWPIDTGGTTYEQAKWLLDGVWKQNMPYPKLSPETAINREGLKASLLRDFENVNIFKWEELDGAWVKTNLGKEVAKNKRYADNIMRNFTENVLKENPILAKAFQRSTKEKGRLFYEANPGTLFNDMMIRAKPDDIAKIRTEVLKMDGGKEAWAAFEFAFMDNLFNRTATSKVSAAGTKLLTTLEQNKVTGELTLLPYALGENIEAMLPKIQKAFPDTYKELKDLPLHYKTVAKELKKSDKARFFSLVGPGVAFAVMGPKGVAMTEAGGLISAWFTLSPMARKILEAGRVLVGKPIAHAAVPSLSAMNRNNIPTKLPGQLEFRGPTMHR